MRPSIKELLRPLVIAAASLALFSACPTTMHNQAIHDYVNRDLAFPTNQITFYGGRRNVDDYSGLDVDPDRVPVNGVLVPAFPNSAGANDDPPTTKNLDVSDNIFIGIEYSEIIRDTVGWEIGFFYSEQEDATRQTYFTNTDATGAGLDPVTQEVKTDIEFIELTIGGRYTHTQWLLVQPYIGAGADIILADIPKPEAVLIANPLSTNPEFLELDVTEYRNQRKLLFGGYAHIGVNLRLGQFLLGVDGRALFWADERINYLQGAITLGYAF